MKFENKCIFCNSIHLEIINYFYTHKCIDCGTDFTVHGNEIIEYSFSIIINTGTYYLDVCVSENTSQISFYPNFAKRKNLWKFNKILDITPKNIKEKIKLYEVFQ